MSDVTWEVDVYFERAGRDPELDDALVEDTLHGQEVYRKTFHPDSFEHGSSGTLAMYYRDDNDDVPGGPFMKRSVSLKHDDMVEVDARRVGEPDAVEEYEDEDVEIVEEDEDWNQESA